MAPRMADVKPDPLPESALSPWRDDRAVVPFLKGRVALHALLRSGGIGPGDEVLVPGFTCFVVPAAILYVGATPVFYDVDVSRLNGDLASAQRRLTERTRALIVQHTFGVMDDPTPARKLAHEQGLLLLEDAAHALGALHGSTASGTIGDGAFSSLQWSKTVSTGLGGLARFNQPALLDRFESIAGDYVEPSYSRQVLLGILEFAHALLYNPRFSWIVQGVYRRLSSKALVPGSSSPAELAGHAEPDGYRTRYGRARHRRLRHALRTVSDVVAHRRGVARIYRESLAATGALMQAVPASARSTELRVSVLVENKRALLEAARRERVELGDWFDAPLHPGSVSQFAFGYAAGSCPRSEWTCKRIVNLPTHRGIGAGEAARILAFIIRRAEWTQLAALEAASAESPHA